MGIRKVAIQTDSAASITLLQNVDAPRHSHAALVAEFQALRNRKWEVVISHVYREANQCADYLANLGHSYCIGLHLFSSPNASLAHWLRYDLVGVALPRVISLIN
ncbi:Putative ribonuclease H protein At1g65750 [Linum perenne]